MVTTTRIELVETHEQQVARMAAKARKDGVKLYRDGRDGRHYASSASTPGRMYYVTAISCDCLGFQTHQHCKHNAALLVALRWSGESAPEAIEALPETVCQTCAGTGTVHKSHSRWIGGGKLGYRSEWTTPEACGACVPDGSLRLLTGGRTPDNVA